MSSTVIRLTTWGFHINHVNDAIHFFKTGQKQSKMALTPISTCPIRDSFSATLLPSVFFRDACSGFDQDSLMVVALDKKRKWAMVGAPTFTIKWKHETLAQWAPQLKPERQVSSVDKHLLIPYRHFPLLSPAPHSTLVTQYPQLAAQRFCVFCFCLFWGGGSISTDI